MKKPLAFCFAILILITPLMSSFAAEEDLPRVWSVVEEMVL